MMGSINNNFHETEGTHIVANKININGNLNVNDQAQIEPNFFQSEDTNYESSKKAIPRRAEDTCNWILQNNAFLRWNQADKSDLLWLTAYPGCGKSVFSKALIDEGLVGRTTDVLVCYFFFKDDQYRRRSASALCAILHQIFSKIDPRLFKKYVYPSIRNFGDALKSHSAELWRILMDVTQDKDVGEVICIFDALDECRSADRNDLIADISDFYNNRSLEERGGRLFKLLITSRPYPEIQDQFLDCIENLPMIHIAGENESKEISSEVNRFIVAEVKKYKRRWHLNSREASHLQTRLSAVTHRTYLWLYLVMKELHKSLGHSKQKLDEVINRLPKTVDQAYEKILKRGAGRGEAKRLLQIVVAAYRPLTVDEIDIALEIRPGITSFCELGREGSQRRTSWIQRSCGLFVNVVDNRVMLIHETAKDFLIQNSSSIWDNQSWKNSINLKDAHSALAKICITFLMLREFRVDDVNLWESSRGRLTAFQSIAASYPFFDYCSFFWHNHVADTRLMEREWNEKVARLCEFRFSSEIAWFGSLFGTSLPLAAPQPVTEESRQWVDWSSLSSIDLLRLPSIYWILITGMRDVARLLTDSSPVTRPYGHLSRRTSESMRNEEGEVIAFLLNGIRFHKWLHISVNPTIRKITQSWNPNEIHVIFLERDGPAATITQGTVVSLTDDIWPEMCSKNKQSLPLLVNLNGARMHIHESSNNAPHVFYSQMKVVLILQKRKNGDIHIIEGAVEVAIGSGRTAEVKTLTPYNSNRADMDFAGLFSMAASRYTILNRPIQNDEFLVLWSCLESIRHSAQNEGVEPLEMNVFDGHVYWKVLPSKEEKSRAILENLQLPRFYWFDGNQARFFAIRWICVCLLVFDIEMNLTDSDGRSLM